MGLLYQSIGFCLIASVIAWPVCYAFLKGLLNRQITNSVQAIALVGTHLTTSIIVALLGPPLSFGASFIVAFIVSPLSVFIVSKKFGTELQRPFS
jgi:hypothetical protein